MLIPNTLSSENWLWTKSSSNSFMFLQTHFERVAWATSVHKIIRASSLEHKIMLFIVLHFMWWHDSKITTIINISLTWQHIRLIQHIVGSNFILWISSIFETKLRFFPVDETVEQQFPRHFVANSTITERFFSFTVFVNSLFSTCFFSSLNVIYRFDSYFFEISSDLTFRDVKMILLFRPIFIYVKRSSLSCKWDSRSVSSRDLCRLVSLMRIKL